MLRIPATLRGGTESGDPSLEQGSWLAIAKRKMVGHKWHPTVCMATCACSMRQGKNILAHVYLCCWGVMVLFLCCRIHVYKTSQNNRHATNPCLGLLCMGWSNQTQALRSGVSISCGFSISELPISHTEGVSTVASSHWAEGHQISLSSSALSFEMMLPVHEPV